MKRFVPLTILLFSMLIYMSTAAHAATPFPTNGGEWRDTGNARINCHGGSILKVGKRYYWYGEHRAGLDADHQKGVACYSSTDLRNWRNEGIVLPVTADTTSHLQQGCKIERPKVIYCPRTGKYMLWFHLELKGRGYEAAYCGVAESRKPAGPFTLLRTGRVNPGIYPLNFDPRYKGHDWSAVADKWWTPEWMEAVKQGVYNERDRLEGQMSRDMTLFVDDNGQAYHIYSSEENLTLQIAELTPDYSRHSGRYIRLFPGGHNEAPVLFKNQGRYWMICSGCTGWAPNKARLFSAADIMGEWEEHPSPFVGEGSETTFQSQGAFPLKVGKDIYFVADEWRPKCLADSRYKIFRIEFRNGMPHIENRTPEIRP